MIRIKNMIPYWIKQKTKDEDFNIEKNEKNIDRNEKNSVCENIDIVQDKEKENLKKFSSDSLVSKIREGLLSYSASIADRTISLRVHQFKTLREDPKELIFGDTKTYRLSSAEIEKYLDAVKKIHGGVESITKKVDHINNISIDQGGFSLDVAEELGMDYLRGNYIVVSIKQKDCDIIRRYTSFSSSFIKGLFDLYYNTIYQILLGECLIGRMYLDKNSLFGIMKNNPENIFDIDVNFDTPSNLMAKLKLVQESENQLLRNVKLIKNRAFLENLLKDIDEIIIKHGSLNRIPISDIVIKNKLNYYKLEFNDLDLYCIRSRKGIPIFIYFDSKDSLEENYIREHSVILNGKQIDNINILVDLEIIGYNPYIGLERAINTIALKRKEKLFKFLQKNPESSEDVKKFLLESLMVEDDIDEDTKTLLLTIESLAKSGRDKNCFFNLGKSKIYMTYPLIQNEILYEILSRMENDEVKSCYSYTKSFIDKISRMDNEELKNYLTEILHHLEFKEDYNLVVNSWLKDNRKEICDELGIKFVNSEKQNK